MWAKDEVSQRVGTARAAVHLHATPGAAQYQARVGYHHAAAKQSDTFAVFLEVFIQIVRAERLHAALELGREDDFPRLVCEAVFAVFAQIWEEGLG